MVIYTKFNSARKKRFQLVTSIIRENDKMFSYKAPASPEATDFLNSLSDKYDYLPHNGFEIKPIRPVEHLNNKLKFNYYTEPPLTYFVHLYLKNHNKKEILELFREYTNLVKSLPQKKEKLSEGFQKIFGQGMNRKHECIQVGCLDLIFDNILKCNTGEYLLIDYEWVFKFPIPYKYIVFRAIAGVYHLFSSYRINKAIVPLKNLYKIMNISDEESDLFIKFEYNFQCYVHAGYRKRVSFDAFKKGYHNLGIDQGPYNSMQFRDGQINNLTRRLQEKENKIQQKSVEIKQMNSDVAAMKSQVRIMKSQIGMMKPDYDEFQGFKNGLIWKSITKYRKLKGRIRSFKKSRSKTQMPER